MRPKDGTAALVTEAGEDVLLKGVVSPALRRRAEEVASLFVLPPGIAIPLLDRIRRVGQDHVELAKAITLDVLWGSQGIAADDLEVLDAMQEEVSSGRRSRLVHGASPNMPASRSGLADSNCRRADWMAMPTFFGAWRTSLQCAPLGIWKRWFSANSA